MQLNKTSLVNICSKTSLMKYSLIGTYFMKTHLYCLPFSFQILPNFSPCCFCYLVSLTEWVMVPHLMCYLLLHDIMDLHMSNLGTLVSQGLCGVFYATRHQITEFQRMTLSLLILWFHITHTHAHTHTHIHTHKQHTTHRGTNRLTHLCKYILSPSAMCSKHLSVLHRMNNLMIPKI